MTKKIILILLLVFSLKTTAQNLQFLYDFRHSVDPTINPSNFPAFSFEYFKDIDTIETGSFLLKLDARMGGTHNNIDQVFTQLSQSLKFWKPKIYLSLTYSGGLGVTPSSFGYYISNSFGLGVSHPFQWKGAWMASGLCFRVNVFEKPSYDPQLSFYFGRGFFNYRIFASGSFVFWTQNRNQGTDYTKDLSGKIFAFYGDPQFWLKVKKGFSVGTRITVYYHIITSDNIVQLYPSLGLKYQF